MSTDTFKQHCREIAKRFLLTAVVVDDELSVTGDPPVHGHLTTPGRGEPTRRGPASAEPQTPAPRPLRVDPITWSFARQGMVCGVVSPQEEQADHKALAKAVARADIVILDWRLNPTTGANALALLKRILTDDQPPRLRLIAFYTGERDHEKIREEIVECLNGLDGPDRAVISSDGSGRAIGYRACRIVVYGKPDSGAVEPGTVVKEEALGELLIADFAGMVEGLLPSLVLTALGAVRENVHRLLECFGRDLDPAFLVHRACLPQPPEAEQHIVEQIASELHGIMDDAVGQLSPAGVGAIEHWLKGRFGDRGIVLAPRTNGTQGKSMSHDDVLAMLEWGIQAEPGPLKKGGKEYDLLSHGFSGGADNSRELDCRLASAMDFRQVVADAARQLSMGTVVRETGRGSAMFLCATPKCDSVRLTKMSAFVFLPLADPSPDTLQVVVPTGQDGHRRMTISVNPAHWLIRHFEPDSARQCVLARRAGPDREFTFEDADSNEYAWVSELKPEFAQSIAQLIADRMSRVPLNRSEWLRRSERR